MPRVFIIVLHYKNWKDTNECLKSLEKLDYDNFKIIVIDNDPENRIQEKFAFKVIKNKENLGFAGGMNVGIKEALKQGADYVLLLNNDVVISPDFLKELIEVGESNKQIGILGPIIREYGSSKIHFAGGELNWLYTKGRHMLNVKHKIQTTDYITGACMLVKREVVKKIGLMFEDYFLYFEDGDWCLRARRKGFRSVVVSAAEIWHKVSQSTVEGSFSYIYYHYRNRLLFIKRNACFFIKILAYLNSFFIYIKQLIKLILFPKKKKWAKAIMKGIRDFYKGKLGKLV